MMLPTEAELEEGYIYGRDFRWSVPITQVRQPVGPLTNQRILNVQNAFDVCRLLSSATHEDVSCLTLRPIEYRPPGEGSPVTFGGVGGRHAFILEVTAWATREGIDPARVPSEVHRFLAMLCGSRWMDNTSYGRVSTLLETSMREGPCAMTCMIVFCGA